MRPMLASTPTEEILKKHLSETPLLASVKLDGIRAITTENGLVSRSLKPIRNKFIQEALQNLPAGTDGELIVGTANSPNVFSATVSGVMSGGGEPDFSYHVFDIWNSKEPYSERNESLSNLIVQPHCHILEQKPIKTFEELEVFEQKTCAAGYEGVIVRRPDSPYKFNRATNREGYLMKIKRFKDSEATIISVNQKFHNANLPVENELGLTSRSSSKKNKVSLEQVGSFEVEDIEKGWIFEVHGFSHSNAALWWENRDSLVGKIITYKYLAVGMLNVPRHPIFKGFRDPIDL